MALCDLSLLNRRIVDLMHMIGLNEFLVHLALANGVA